MPDTDVVLSAWQKRLEEHFESLRNSRRKEIGSHHPIFALEHGLNDNDLAVISDGVRAQIANGAPVWRHRLPWIVYASELGYRFSGDEYWQTFEDRTPGWYVNGDRNWMRRCFQDFQELFNGAQPMGTWASHFNIICWPITHAILPQDLQRQFAKLLYELRNIISAGVLFSPCHLGELIARHSQGTSSRFRQFAEEPLLLGQIAAALLLQDEEQDVSLILPSTLQRIGADLNRERCSRAWMAGAQECAKKQLRLATAQGQGKVRLNVDDGAAPVPELGLEPRLLLCPSVSGEYDWDLHVELPDFGSVLARHPGLRNELLVSRCRVTGSSERPLARGRLLYGTQKVQLLRWPMRDVPLLKFEQPSAKLAYLLGTGCNLRPGPVWLFRIAKDGQAYELRGKHVRSGHRYVLISESDNAKSAVSAIRSTRLSCEGVNAVFINLPESITRETEDALKAIGLSLASTVRIWPAGLAPTKWDGEGNVEWLSGDTPCVGVKADTDVGEFTLQLGKRRIDVTPTQTGAPVFVELPGLPVGRHTLLVKVHDAHGRFTGISEDLIIQVRERSIWHPESNTRGALLIMADPPTPSLEALWGGGVNIEAYGPKGRNIRCTFSLYDQGEKLPRVQKEVAGIPLPMRAENWSAVVDKWRVDRQCQNSYDLAQRCELRFAAGDLGDFVLTAEREFAPVRWALRRQAQSYYLKVVDHTGATDPQVNYVSFQKPDVAQSKNASSFTTGNGIEVCSGMYVVSSGEHNKAIVIPPQQLRALTDLNVNPNLCARTRTPGAILDLIRSLDLWTGARITGDVVSNNLRGQVLTALYMQLFQLICGERWGGVERTASMQSAGVACHTILEGFPPKEMPLAKAIAKDAEFLIEATPRERVEHLKGLSLPYLGFHNKGQVANDPKLLCEFTLRLANWPAGVLAWANTRTGDLVAQLLDNPGCARATRLVAALVNVRNPSLTHGRDLFLSDWRWS